MRIRGSSLGGRNLNYVGRCGIWILIVRIIKGRRYRYCVIRPPVWSENAPNNHSAEKSSEYGSSRRTPPVIVSPIAAIIMAAIITTSAGISGMPATAATSMTTTVAILSIGRVGKSNNSYSHTKRYDR